jgi:hypothetical protein
MIVWNWVQQHRVLSVLILAVVIVTTAGGTAWALVFRTVSSPVGLREALRVYRKEQTAKVLGSLRAHLPAPGVYTYRTTGGESLSLVGMSRGFPSRTSMVVADDRCATVSWLPLVQHTETTTICATPGDGLQLPKLVTFESIAGSQTTSTIECPATAWLLPPSPSKDMRWSATCSLVNPKERVSMTGTRLGSSTMTVGGQAVDVDHVRVDFRFEGAQSGTNPTDFWVVPSTGLIVREHELVSADQSGVHYSESMDTVLTGLSPVR